VNRHRPNKPSSIDDRAGMKKKMSAAEVPQQSMAKSSTLKPENVSLSLKGIKYVIFPNQKCESIKVGCFIR